MHALLIDQICPENITFVVAGGGLLPSSTPPAAP